MVGAYYPAQSYPAQAGLLASQQLGGAWLRKKKKKRGYVEAVAKHVLPAMAVYATATARAVAPVRGAVRVRLQPLHTDALAVLRARLAVATAVGGLGSVAQARQAMRASGATTCAPWEVSSAGATAARAAALVAAPAAASAAAGSTRIGPSALAHARAILDDYAVREEEGLLLAALALLSEEEDWDE